MKYLLFLLTLCCFITVQGRERFIYVARHCQAAGRKHSHLQPVAGDAGITKLGIQQSRNLGKRLKTLSFKGKIYASPYYRTVATACFAAEEAGVKVYPDARVQERVHRNGGNMKRGGATLKQLRSFFPNQIAEDATLSDSWLYKKEEPEKTPAHRKRMAKALDDLLAENPDSDIMIVSHAGAVGSLAAEMKKRCKKKFSGGTWNCALYIYAVDAKGKFRFVGYDVSFLTAEMITANMHKIDPKRNPKLRKVKSGVDYKYNL